MNNIREWQFIVTHRAIEIPQIIPQIIPQNTPQSLYALAYTPVLAFQGEPRADTKIIRLAENLGRQNWWKKNYLKLVLDNRAGLVSKIVDSWWHHFVRQEARNPSHSPPRHPEATQTHRSGREVTGVASQTFCARLNYSGLRDWCPGLLPATLSTHAARLCEAAKPTFRASELIRSYPYDYSRESNRTSWQLGGFGLGQRF